MRFKDLNEADGSVPNFADQAAGTLKNVGDLAKRALSKWRGASEKTAQNIAAAKAQTQARAQPSAPTEPVVSAAPPAPQPKNTRSSRMASLTTAPMTVAKIILSRAPDANDLPELENLSTDEFNNIQNATSQMQTRLDTFSKKLPAAIKASELIQANEQKDIAKRLGPQSERITDAADDMLARSTNGEQAAWMSVLTNDDPSLGAKAIILLIRKIGNKHAALNAADMARPNGRKTRAEGLNLLNMVGAQIHILDDRLRDLQIALAILSSRPITAEQLKNIRGLLKRL